MNIYLIGYRGTGKSTLAPLLVRRLTGPWSDIDMDSRVEQAAGQPIAQIFAERGEPFFRDLEAKLLAQLAQGDHWIVSTGGGVIERAENREVLERGFTVWLEAPADVIADRLARDPQTAGQRPALSDKSVTEEVAEILARRSPLYESVAKLRLRTDRANPEDLADRIAREFKRATGRSRDD